MCGQHQSAVARLPTLVADCSAYALHRRTPIVVVGITGSSRSGKSWLSKELSKCLLLPHGAVVEQDRFWRRSSIVQTADGRRMVSEDEPECTDSDAFLDAIRCAISEAQPLAGCDWGCVIVEGFQLLHDKRVVALLDHIFLLDLSKEELLSRRTAPWSDLNRNPANEDYCKLVVWPAHERYMQTKVQPLGEWPSGRVRRFEPPTTAEDVASIVSTIERHIEVVQRQRQDKLVRRSLCPFSPNG
mmetsp:Transcript_2246/g.5053  ORF Transcript_2246/g.5053 Transcript_2246/m.5053 type:complete len:243 (+) Transcript_2246:63-791(+)|eukprot:CAMPEP_0197915402 /NCGR_PEP_ID=MMETSP1439-20131203/80132_1 /TAXON_ID=66791 /ORGANISM="Gonyaulax spinifera, Strain CCMP409" /LENGTH=242 /DNA_ID=CAMNT_0043537355 /DNA_START=58 /DNA_END=786 /DNA_ORIENTATION=-